MVFLLIYFFVYFLTLWSIQAAAVETQSNNLAFNYQSGFSTEMTRYNPNANICLGRTDLIRKGFFAPNYIPCVVPDYLQNNLTCSQYPGCYWDNLTRTCINEITDFNVINMSTPESVCLNMSTSIECIGFHCEWTNYSAYFNQKFTIASPYGFYTTMIDAISLMTGFRVSIGLGQLGFIFVFFFTYIPIFLLLLAAYFALR